MLKLSLTNSLSSIRLFQSRVNQMELVSHDPRNLYVTHRQLHELQPQKGLAWLPVGLTITCSHNHQQALNLS